MITIDFNKVRNKYISQIKNYYKLNDIGIVSKENKLCNNFMMYMLLKFRYIIENKNPIYDEVKDKIKNQYQYLIL